MESGQDWAQPQEISPAVQAFPAKIIGTLLPPLADIPTDFDQQGRWTQFATRVSTGTWDGHDPALIRRDNVDADRAWTHILTIVGSFEPRFEHKVAGVAWLLSQWFLDVVPRSELQDADGAGA